MGKATIAWIVVILVASIFIGGGCATYNNLQREHQAAKGGKSHYGAALDLCSQKIAGVWTATNQLFEHESEVQTGVAQARSGYMDAAEVFKMAASSGADIKTLTEAASKATAAALNFKVQVEQTPQLVTGQATRDNVRNMQEAVNEMKTALDDWIADIQTYNTYRGSAWPSFLSTVLSGFFNKFPSELEYYEGSTQSLDMNSLNPQK